LELVTGLESGFDSLVLHQQAASLPVIYAGSAGRAGLLGLKLMTLGLKPLRHFLFSGWQSLLLPRNHLMRYMAF